MQKGEKKRVGRYFIEGALSKGGMGEVYLATLRGDAGFNKRVVIKLAKAEFSNKESMRKQFIREATLTAQLSHQNIVQIFDFGIDGGRPYIVMEYVEGLSLRDLLNLNIKFSENVVASILSQILSGLDEAFQRKIIHRDLSPSNILINKHGIVKIADFGLAKIVSEPFTGEIWGKPQYVAPEVINGEAPDQRSDLYSVGKIGKELIGESVFSIATIIDTLILPHEHRPASPSLVLPFIKQKNNNGSEELATLVSEHFLVSIANEKTFQLLESKTGKLNKNWRVAAALSGLVWLLSMATGSVDHPKEATKEEMSSVVHLNAAPWAYVYINGMFAGETPIIGKKVSPGNYKILFKNPSLSKTKEFRLNLRPGKEESLFYSFQQVNQVSKVLNKRGEKKPKIVGKADKRMFNKKFN